MLTGQLDTSFDSDGKVSTDMGGDDYSQGLAIQADNKIVVVGYAEYVTGEADSVQSTSWWEIPPVKK